MSASQHKLELLAPARNAGIAIESIRHGADAVYIGAPSHGARADACNTIDDIKKVVDYAHVFDARVYVTLNTLIYDDELRAVERLIGELYRVGVDALIVQDMAVLELNIPPIALHASTQCDIRTPAKAAFLERVGFSQLVLPRELSLDEIAAVRQVTMVPLEAFVHGALCVSYSGDCQASLMATGRSANRGCCAQLCRLPYALEDASGRKIITDKHLLSLRDMNRIDRLRQMIDSGISSFKIEGRLKNVDYVKNTVAAYHLALNRIIAESGGRLSRSSLGRVDLNFTPDVSKSFNRGFTSYFLEGPDSKIGSINTPKWIGVPVGTVTSGSGNKLKIKLSAELHNGDGLGYFDDNGTFGGFRVNKVEKGLVYAARNMRLKSGTVIYRNNDKLWGDMLAGETASRKIEIDIRLRGKADWITLDVCGGGLEVSMRVDGPFGVAKTPQCDARKRNFAKLGNSSFVLRDYHDSLPDVFIPASQVSQLRRDAVSMLEQAIFINHKLDYRKPGDLTAKFPVAELTYHDNVANQLAENFYKRHGVERFDRALEVAPPDFGTDVTVMTTRYCLRREMGHCLKQGDRTWHGPLFLTSNGIRFRLDFDCRSCRMKVVKPAMVKD